MLLGAVFLAWALDATFGFSAAAAARRTLIGSLIDGIDAALMVGSGIGIQLMIRGRHSGLAAALTWLGSGSMFGWGLWQTANVLGQSALFRGAEGQPLIQLMGPARVISGLALGQLMLFVLAERRSATAPLRPG